MKNKVSGPKMQEDGAKVTLPDCIDLKTEKDHEELKEFISSIVRATQDNCLELLANKVARDNATLAELVKKLGGP